MRLERISLAANIGKLQFLVSGDNFFCWVYNNFYSDFLLYDVIDFARIKKSIVESSSIGKTFSDRLSSFERCWNSLLCLSMALRRSLLRIDKVSVLETFGSLKISNFGYTPSCLQLLRWCLILVYYFCTLVFHVFESL